MSLAERIDGIYFYFLNKCVTFIGDKEYLVLLSIILVGIVGLISLVLFFYTSSSTPSGGVTDSGSGEKKIPKIKGKKHLKLRILRVKVKLNLKLRILRVKVKLNVKLNLLLKLIMIIYQYIVTQVNLYLKRKTRVGTGIEGKVEEKEFLDKLRLENVLLMIFVLCSVKGGLINLMRVKI